MGRAQRTRKPDGRSGRRERPRARSPRLEPYAWLGLGAVTLGVGAAVATGTGVAHADISGTSASPSAPSTGPSGDAGTPDPKQEKSSGSVAQKTEERPTGGADRATDKSHGGGPSAADNAGEVEVATGFRGGHELDDDARHNRGVDADPIANSKKTNEPDVAADSETEADGGASDPVEPAAEQRNAAKKDSTRTAAGPLDQFAALLDNKSPTISLTPTGQGADGAVSGVLTAKDPDSSTLTYSVTREPAHGTVALLADGSYTYTPDPQAPGTSSSDSFSVTVSDAHSGFHIHGVSGLVNLLTLGLIGNSGHTSTATAQLTQVAATPDPKIIMTIDLGLANAAAPRSLATSPDGRLVFVGSGQWEQTWGGFHPSLGSLSVIDTTTNTVISSVDTDWTPIASSVGPSGVLYTVGMIGGVGVAEYVLSTMRPSDYLTQSAFNETRTIEGLSLQPISVTTAPDGHSVVIGGRNGQIAVVDSMTATVIRTADLGFENQADRVFITPDSRTAWVSGGYFQPLFKIDLTTGAISSVSVPYSVGATMSPDGRKLYVLTADHNNNTERVQVVDTATGNATSFDPFTEGLYTNVVDLSVSPDGRFLFLRDANSSNSYTTNSLNVVDTTTGVVVASMAVPAPSNLFGLQDMVVSPDGNRVYLATGNYVTVVKANTTDRPALPAMVQSSTAADLLINLPRQTDTIYAEKVVGEDHRTRMIVYMSGIDGGLNESTLASIFSNGGLLHLDVQTYIDSTYEAWGGAAQIDEIQLVGHSNGGQQMQAYAAAGTYRDQVKSVVVFGAPLTKTEDDFTSEAVAFVNRNDPVPRLFTRWSDPGVEWKSDSKSIYWFASEEPVGGVYLVDFKYHDAASYYRIAAQFDDPSRDPADTDYRARRAAIARFGGTSVDFMPANHVSALQQPTGV